MPDGAPPSAPFFNRQALHLRPDPSRVVVRPFRPAVEPRDLHPVDKTRANHIVDRVLAMTADETDALLAETLRNFDDRHRNLPAIFERRAAEMEDAFTAHKSFSQAQRQLVGAYFLHEYSFEAAALFNPSIVPHPDQSGVAAGCRRFILSLRAVGEGHISSLTFRSGILAADGTVTIDPPARLAATPVVTARVGDRLELGFDPASDIAERVIFPVTERQANGIEDARFVAFHDEGQTIYYATFTAYSGSGIRSELIETRDFVTFHLAPLKGAAARNKGMALFPRKIGGRYAMIARHDNESLHLILSDDLHEWGLGEVIVKPEYPWEFVQIGNCGAPILIDEGWLLLTHGVGAMRQYSIGAVLLDRDDPSKIIGRTRNPILQAEDDDRNGYVPNVVYTCGGMRVGDQLFMPYGISDSSIGFAFLPLKDLVAAME